jgi:hypothetical protein
VDPARPTEKLTAFKRTRIVLEAGDLVRPLLALTVSSDGGLIIDLSGSAPTSSYRYGVLDVPAGEGSWTAPIREHEASWSVSVAPKLHYHRSGFISLNATRHLKRHGIRATPPGEIGPNHKHCFSFVARHPLEWTATQRRKNDLVFALSRLPTTITIAGFVGPISNLKQASRRENPWAIMAANDDGSEIVPTVVARLQMQDPQYYVWVELHPDKPFGDGDDPGLILYAFDADTAADHASATEMVGVWSVPANDVPPDA